MQMRMQQTEPRNVPIFGAEDLRSIERINAEIARLGRLARSGGAPALPLFGDEKDEG